MTAVEESTLVKDLRDRKFYECKAIQKKEDLVKVHFVGWKKAFDEWVDITSDRICRDNFEQADLLISVNSLENFT